MAAGAVGLAVIRLDAFVEEEVGVVAEVVVAGGEVLVKEKRIESNGWLTGWTVLIL